MITQKPLQEAVAFLLSPEAAELRPLLVTELVVGLDLAARDRARRLAARLRPQACHILTLTRPCDHCSWGLVGFQTWPRMTAAGLRTEVRRMQVWTGRVSDQAAHDRGLRTEVHHILPMRCTICDACSAVAAAPVRMPGPGRQLSRFLGCLSVRLYLCSRPRTSADRCLGAGAGAATAAAWPLACACAAAAAGVGTWAGPAQHRRAAGGARAGAERRGGRLPAVAESAGWLAARRAILTGRLF